jgi:Aspartate/tyrosine/aromatic aminotransferase
MNSIVTSLMILCQHYVLQSRAFLLPQRTIDPSYQISLAKPVGISNSRKYTSNEEIQQQGDYSTTDKAPCYDSVCASNPEEDTNHSMSSLTSSASSPPSSSSSSRRTGNAMQRLGTSSSGPTVWTEFGRLAMSQPSIVNLGQGFPNWLPPQFAIDALVEGATDVAHNSPHQYTRTAGHPKLVQELAGRYSRHLHREIDPFGQVAVTVGASQALYLALQTLIQPGE